MNQINKGMQEDVIQSKLYDKVLFRRLIVYLNPYKFLVYISFFLLLLITSVNLLAPVITQRAVDEVIVSNNNLLKFSRENEKSEFVEKYSRIKFKEFIFGDNYYLIFLVFIV